MPKQEPQDITNAMLMTAIHDVKSDLKSEIKAVRSEMHAMETRLENKMDAMEVRIENKMESMECRLIDRIVYESDLLAKAMVPSNKELAREIKVIKKHVGLAV